MTWFLAFRCWCIHSHADDIFLVRIKRHQFLGRYKYSLSSWLCLYLLFYCDIMAQDQDIEQSAAAAATQDSSVQMDDTQPHELSPEEKQVEKRLVRKLDYHLMVWAWVIVYVILLEGNILIMLLCRFFAYWANGLDRNNMRMSPVNKWMKIQYAY